jgi:hypothetical protein
VAAYRAYADGVFRFERRDMAAGVLGVLEPTSAAVAEAEDLDELQLLARAHVGVHPNDSLYLVGPTDEVRAIVLNRAHHEEVGNLERRFAATVALLFMSLLFLLATVADYPPALCLIGYFIMASVYVVVVRVLRLQNEVEGAVILTLLFLVGMLSLHFALRGCGSVR